MEFNGNTNPIFSYPEKLNIFLKTLAVKYSANPNQSIYKKIIDNAIPDLEEGVEYDNWNGGVYGHKLTLYIPADIYKLLGNSAKKYEDSIRNDMNDIGKISGECINVVSILVNDERSFTENKSYDSSMWGAGFRVFISHRVEDKQRASALKNELAAFGISAFVAHEDIEPSKEWLSTIENALLTMDAFVALITEGYNEKIWTNQEIGFAYCMNKLKGIPYTSIRIGDDPKGFVGHIQALTPRTNDYTENLCNQWINHPRMIDSLIVAIEKSSSYTDSHKYFCFLEKTSALSEDQVKRLISAFNANPSVHKCYKLNGGIGDGILPFLNKMSKTNWEYTQVEGKVKITELPF